MSKNNSYKTMHGFIFALSLLASTASIAWHGHGGGGWHEGSRHYPGYGNHYNRNWAYGGGFYFGGGGWGGPNVIINVPAPGYYVPECHNVEVCNSYGDCWLESRCN